MSHHKLYTLAIRYFMLFVILLLASGVALFWLELAIESKSIETIIEILTPHLIGMGLTLFVIAHFLLSSTKFTQNFSLKIFLALAVIILLDQSSYLFILMGFEVFGWIKLVSLLLYILLSLVLLWMLGVSL